VEEKEGIVAAERSPGGKPVSIEWVQNATDILERLEAVAAVLQSRASGAPFRRR